MLLLFCGLLLMGSGLNINNTQAQTRNVQTKHVICIDPGHQAKGDSHVEAISPGSSIKKAKVTTGATGIKTKITESQLALTVSKQLRKSLVNSEYEVVITREKQDVNISNQRRAQICNQVNAEITIRIHADSSTNPTIRGYSVLYPDSIVKSTNLIASQSLAFAKTLDQNYEKITGIQSRGLHKRGDLTGFNWSTVPTVVLEMGFLSNPEEDQLINSSKTQIKIVTAITKAIQVYFGKLKQLTIIESQLKNRLRFLF